MVKLPDSTQLCNVHLLIVVRAVFIIFCFVKEHFFSPSLLTTPYLDEDETLSSVIREVAKATERRNQAKLMFAKKEESNGER